MKPPREELSEIRRRFLELNGADLEEIHGWLVGVTVAVERLRGVPFEVQDNLISELRVSTWPPNLPDRCPRCGSQRLHYCEVKGGTITTCRVCGKIERSV